MKAIALVLLIAACSSCEKPRPPLPPADGDGTCETAAATLQKLGGCGLHMDRYVANCHAAEKEEAEHGVRHPNTCVTRADSCSSAFACK